MKDAKIPRILTILPALSLSLYSFILLFSQLRNRQVEKWFERAPVKLVPVYLLLVALAPMVLVLVVCWITEEDTVAIVFGVLSVASVTIFPLLFRKLRVNMSDESSHDE
jgi:L-asparagine transporter-like permease